jgi:hypothetical protein
MKRINYFVGLMLLFTLFACGSSDKQASIEPAPQLITIEGMICGEGEIGYLGKNGYGDIVPLLKTTLEVHTKDDFEGKIMFEFDCNDPKAKGIFSCDNEYDIFNNDFRFKQVKLTLEKADSNFVDGYFIRKIEILPSPKISSQIVNDVEVIPSSAWETFGKEIHPNEGTIAVTHINKIKDTYYAFSTVDQSEIVQGDGLEFLIYGTGEGDKRGMMKLVGEKWEQTSYPVKGIVNSSIPYQNQQLIFGRYESIGGAELNNASNFDGTSFSILGDKYALGTMERSVNACINYKNKIYAAGSFHGLSYGISMWDGKKWNVVGKGSKDDSDNRICNGLCSGSVLDLKVYKGDLYAAGTFEFADGKRVNGIAKWDGKKWNSIGAGVLGEIYSMEVYKGKLYVAGAFDNLAGNKANSLAMFDGKEWTILDLPLQANYYDIAVITNLKVIGDRLYLGGDFILDGADYSIFNIISFDSKKLYSVGRETLYKGRKIYGFNGKVKGFYSEGGLNLVYGNLLLFGSENTNHIMKIPN